MTHLLIVILDDLTGLPDLIQAWRKIGVPGATILESAGSFRMESWIKRVGLGNLDRLFEAKEVRRRTLMVAIEDDELLAQAVAEAEQVVGGFDRPDSGLLLVLPVTQVKGLKKVMQKPSQVVLPPAVLPNWVVLRNTPVEEVVAVFNLEPTIINADTPLEDIPQKMLIHPNVHVACVVAEDDRLVGLLGLRALADDIFFHILPEEFLSEISDMDEAMEFANRSHMRTAADAMQDPVWVKQGETVKDAFKRMHEHDLAGLPVVNNLYHVVGYINLLELLAICMKKEDEMSGADGAL
ncbi:MAG: CBS domain-containing protein [Anaerolineales bacterium]|nr:CBS domain-containing protein [Anaerolineales bacterium]